MKNLFRLLALAGAFALAAQPTFAAPVSTQYVPPYFPPYSSYPSVFQRAPLPTDDVTSGYALGNYWLYNNTLYQNQRATAGAAVWSNVAAAPLPLDAVAGASIAYGTKKLRAGYTGAALVITRTSDSTTATIGFLANGQIDTATGDAFCAGIAQTACLVTTWFDQSGNGYNATQTTPGNAPLWSNVATVNGIRAVSFASVSQVVTNQTQAPRYLTVPTGFSWALSSSSWFFVGQQNGSQEPHVLAENTSHYGFLTGYTFPSSVNRFTLAGVGSTGYCGMATTGEPTVLAVTYNGTTINCSDNNTSATNSVPTPAGTGSGTGANIGTSNNNATAANMDALAVVAYATPLSAANFSLEKQALASTFSVAMQAKDTLFVDGDSTSSGAGSLLDNTFAKLSLPMLQKPVILINNAKYGDTLQNIVARINYGPAAYYNPSARNYVVEILAGPNDIRQGASLATLQSALQTYVSTLKALGPNVRVIVGTAIQQCGLTTAQLTTLQGLDAYIRANSFSADAIADYQADPYIGQGNPTTSAFCSFPSAVSPDGQHPTDATMYYFATVLANAVNQVLR